jgi:hypothetical protein
MICPQCKCQYIRGVTQCSDCGVALVDRLEPEGQASPEDVRLVAVWRGADAAERDQVGEAFESADIPFTFAEAKSVLFRTSETTLEVWVDEQDQEKASQIVGDLEDRLYPDESLTEQDAEPAPSEPDAPQEDDDDAGPDSDLEREWDEDEPVSEVWSGDDEGLADTLITCFREVGIASRKEQGTAKWRVVVRPAQGKRARGIVGEVVDATPPE